MQHITKEQRYPISTMLSQGYGKQAIADCIGKNKSSIYREIKRNKDKRNGSYRYNLAEKKCRERHRHKKKQLCFTHQMKDKVEALLREDYSPEQVVSYCKKIDFTCVSRKDLSTYGKIKNKKKIYILTT